MIPTLGSRANDGVLNLKQAVWPGILASGDFSCFPVRGPLAVFAEGSERGRHEGVMRGAGVRLILVVVLFPILLLMPLLGEWVMHHYHHMPFEPVDPAVLLESLEELEAFCAKMCEEGANRKLPPLCDQHGLKLELLIC